jgi:acetylornithine deacetylase/succinyl-diaminopimelate desuccinylase-like protein
MLRFYADPLFARAFRYDHEDLSRARRNEERAAQYGLSAEIENPFNAKTIAIRQFLDWTLNEVRPLAEATGLWEDLSPLVEMARGAPNAAEQLRLKLSRELRNTEIVPQEILVELALEREKQVQADTEFIAADLDNLEAESGKLGKFLQISQQAARLDPQAPIRFLPFSQSVIRLGFTDKLSEITHLASDLVRIPSVTACPQERLEDVSKAARLIYDYLQRSGLEVRFYDQDRYPAILAGFPGKLHAAAMLSGHFDVVEPEPDDLQFEPRIEGDYLWGRGAADMKTVVATNMVWLKDRLRLGPPYPPINLLLVGNEENGEADPMGSPHLLDLLKEKEGYAPQLFIAGERTGESGNELWGEICIQNRGVIRLDVAAHGQRGHSGVAGVGVDLSQRILSARNELDRLCSAYLTLKSVDGWQSQARFPFIQVGVPGVYNVTPSNAIIGVEIRPIPQDNVRELLESCQAYCDENSLELLIRVNEPGIACDPANPYLTALIAAVRDASGQEPHLGRKLPGTSARFAPGGQGVVWGQTGIGPHSKDERHYLPSVMPYYQALTRYAEILLNRI